MADILIRGVEMPNSCEKCPFNDYEQGFCFAAWKFNESGWPDFSLNVGCQETRNHRCPLVPLPEGHGRLIDADALLEQIRDGFEKAEQWRDAVENDPEIRPRAEATVVAFWECGAKVKMAPTVVPAEGGVEE